MISKKLIQHKLESKKKQPKFIRQEYHKRKRLKKVWRKPKGVQSKLRLKRRGKPKMVSIGYKIPEKVRGLTKKGLAQVMVSSPEHIKYIKSNEIAVIKKVSNKTRLAILEAAQKANIPVLNFKDISKKIEEIKKKLNVKKEARKIKEERKKKRAEDEKKKAKMSEKHIKKEQKPIKKVDEAKLTKEQKEKLGKTVEKAKEEVKSLSKILTEKTEKTEKIEKQSNKQNKKQIKKTTKKEKK